MNEKAFETLTGDDVGSLGERRVFAPAMLRGRS
jgi:hypothetical protein